MCGDIPGKKRGNANLFAARVFAAAVIVAAYADGVDTGALDSEIQFSTGARGKAVPIGRRGWCLAMGLVAIGREGHSEAARRVYTRQEENAACWRQLATRSACVCGRRRRTDRSLP